jgi:hypothetical protein
MSMICSRNAFATAGAFAFLTGAAMVALPAAASAADSLNAPEVIAAASTDAGAAKGHIAKAAFSQPVRPSSGEAAATTKVSAGPGVVVTYIDNGSSVVVTEPRFGFAPRTITVAPAKSGQ